MLQIAPQAKPAHGLQVPPDPPEPTAPADPPCPTAPLSPPAPSFKKDVPLHPTTSQTKPSTLIDFIV
jgi:hypothetical protein